jgi:glyoxylase-like metal-dependent hydrolase (beta-lactamase superfamily II)
MSNATITVGNVTITAISDGGGEFPIKISQVFAAVPADAWHPVRERYPHVFARADTWNIEFNSFLVQSKGATILVDTGIGERKIRLLGDAGGKLMDSLRANAVGPADIDTVISTTSAGTLPLTVSQRFQKRAMLSTKLTGRSSIDPNSSRA